MDVLSPFIYVLCHSDWLFHGESCPRLDVVHPGRAWSSSPACTWHWLTCMPNSICGRTFAIGCIYLLFTLNVIWWQYWQSWQNILAVQVYYIVVDPCTKWHDVQTRPYCKCTYTTSSHQQYLSLASQRLMLRAVHIIKRTRGGEGVEILLQCYNRGGDISVSVKLI